MSTQKNNNSPIEIKALSLDDIVNKLQDPDLYYFYIKQTYENSKKGADLDEIPKNKKILVNTIYELEVFRATMQYVEEFAIYFLSYIKGSKEISRRITQIMPKDLKKEFFSYLIDNKHDEFAQKNGSENYYELLKEIFGYNRISKKDYEINSNLSSMIENSVKCLKKDIDLCIKFYMEYLEIYNAIKHGNRIFPQKSSKITIVADSKVYNQDIDEYFMAICKASDTDVVYDIILPVNIMVKNSWVICEKIHEMFKFLRRNVKNKLSNAKKFEIKIFKCAHIKETGHNVVKFAGNDILILPHSTELDEIISNNKFLLGGACNLKIKKKTLELHFNSNTKCSQDYPISIKFSGDLAVGLSPKILTEHNIHIDINKLSVSQYLNLLKIQERVEKGELKNIQIFDDLNKIKITDKMNINDIGFLEIPKRLNDEILNFLLILEKSTGEWIPIPYDLSHAQELIITENYKKSISSRDDAKKILLDLQKKLNKIHYTNFYLRKMDSNSEEICYQNLGEFKDIFISLRFKNSELQKEFHNKISEKKPYIFKVDGIDEDPNNFTERIKMFLDDPLKNAFPLLIKNSDNSAHNPKFDYCLKFSSKEEFWYIENKIEITIKLLSS